MTSNNNLVTALTSGGLGAALGGVVTAILQITSKRGESHAVAADLVTKAAGALADRLSTENHQLREAVLLLTDVLDEVLPVIDAEPAVIDKLRRAKIAAQRAI